MKKIAIISAAIMSLIMNTSCFNTKTSFISDQLQKKYNKPFEVRIVTGSLTSSEYRCNPKDRNDVIFRVELINGKDIVDGYEEALLGEGIKQKLIDKMPELKKDSAVKVFVKKGAEGFTDLSTTADFIKKSDGVRFKAFIAVDKASADKEKLIEEFKAAVRELGNVYGSVTLSVTDKDSVNEIGQILADSVMSTNKLLDACGDDALIMKFENGIFEVVNVDE